MRYLLMLAMLLGAMSAYAGDSQDQGDGRRGDDRSGPPKVYDAQGKYVGRLETNSNQDGVFLTINGAVTFVGIGRLSVGSQISATQFQWASVGVISYPSTDCSGPPLLEYVSGPRPSMAVRQGADVVLYVAGEANSTTVHASSTRQNPNINVCSPFSFDLNQVFIPDTPYPLTQMYPEPLTIRP